MKRPAPPREDGPQTGAGNVPGSQDGLPTTKLEGGRLRALAELLTEGLHFYRLEGGDRLVFVGGNPAADRIFGVDSARALGQPVEEAFPLLAATKAPDHLRRLARGTSSEIDEALEVTGEGLERRLHLRAMRLPPWGVVALYREALPLDEPRGDDDARFGQVNSDVHRMEALGRLAGSIAHEFNNLLTGIAGNVELMSLDISEADPLRGRLREVRRATERGAALTSQLLAFSRRQMLSTRMIDLNEVIDRMHFMIERVLGENIKLDLICARDLGAIEADPGQAEQILVNLVTHARDALAAGGMVTIVTENITLDERACRQRPGLRPGPHVRLRVRDSGRGLPPEALGRLFEPFFSAGTGGRGGGLGLATVYGIVRQHGGHIEASSELGWGTTVDVFFPRAEGAAPPLTAPTTHDHLRGHGETILVAEDEPVVRQVTCRLLERLGYHVIEASQGAEALRLAKEHPGAVDLLLTDVVMPHMNGRELADRLRTLQPEMRVIYMSGHPDDIILELGVNEERINFLAKPYTPESLALAIHRALAELREDLETP
ncbi:MAG: response regulator [Polyangia bacterium]|jgi:signal transduction histidine kinase/ActR/RegA family two-component response regulator|nr:response regulator [Polyangia bacterium]